MNLFSLTLYSCLICNHAFQHLSALNRLDVTANMQSWSQSELMEKIRDRAIDRVTFLTPSTPGVEDAVAIDDAGSAYHIVHLVPGSSDQVVNRLMAADIPFDAQTLKSPVDALLSFGTNGLMAVLALGFAGSLLRSLFSGFGGGSNTPPMPSFMSRNRKPVENVDTGFEDVAGCDEAKFELEEITDFLRNPGRYEEAGARAPKGVLLEGPPGTGKTLLARAVAGEADVPFFSASASEFIEMFVGVGASRVRTLFESAEKAAPCVVFIDEIDAIGRQRGGTATGGNDEREQTLNQILTSMDGFKGNGGVVVLAATNRVDILDPALTRPGRFDRTVRVGLPDLAGRKEIAAVHLRDKTVGDDFDIDELAALTTGFSGAALENLANEAAIQAVRRNDTVIGRPDLLSALEKITIGPEKKRQDQDPDVRRLVALHEAGHAIAANEFPEYFVLRTVTTRANVAGAGGYTLFTPVERYSMYATKRSLLAQLVVAMGGRAAEIRGSKANMRVPEAKEKAPLNNELSSSDYREQARHDIENSRLGSRYDNIVLQDPLFPGVTDLDVSTGASGDLQQAEQLARAYIGQFGLKEAPAMVSGPACGDASRTAVDAEVVRLLRYALGVALAIIDKNPHGFRRLTNELMHKQVLSGADVRIALG